MIFVRNLILKPFFKVLQILLLHVAYFICTAYMYTRNDMGTVEVLLCRNVDVTISISYFAAYNTSDASADPSKTSTV